MDTHIHTNTYLIHHLKPQWVFWLFCSFQRGCVEKPLGQPYSWAQPTGSQTEHHEQTEIIFKRNRERERGQERGKNRTFQGRALRHGVEVITRPGLPQLTVWENKVHPQHFSVETFLGLHRKSERVEEIKKISTSRPLFSTTVWLKTLVNACFVVCVCERERNIKRGWKTWWEIHSKDGWQTRSSCEREI